MKKIRQKLILMIILLLELIPSGIKAATEYKGKLYELWHPDSGFTVFAEESNGWMDYNSWMIKSTIDDRIYYCIDPALPLEGSKEGEHVYIVNKNDIIKKTNMTEEKYKKVNLIAYYGYGYKDSEVDHTSKRWYGITQVMIWRVMRPDLNWTFKKNRNENPDKSLYIKEVNEINSLVEKHNIKPSINSEWNKPIKVLYGEEKTFEDFNKVLHKYKSYMTNSAYNAKIENDTLAIKGLKNTPSANMKFILNSRTSEKFALFSSTEHQDIIVLGEPLDNYWDLFIEVTGGLLKLEKKDYTTEKNIPQGDATLKNAEYEIYNEKEEKIGKIITDANGKGEKSLESGKYIVKETKSPKGYKLNEKKYEINIENGKEEVLEVKDKIITGKLKIHKTKGGANESFKEEENAEFEIINSKKEIIEIIKTNEKGLAIKELPYGNYILHQIKGDENYEFTKDIYLEIKEDKIYEVEIKNIKKSVLEIEKKDSLTNEPIKGVTFEIYDEINNEIVEKNKTDNNGKLVVENLNVGKYLIKELETSPIHKLLTEKTYFEITKNGEYIKKEIKNERKKANLVFVKTDKSGTKKLKNAKIELIFKETNKKIFEGITNKEGKIEIKNLYLGKYCIKETKAPQNYKRHKKEICFDLKNEGETVTIILKNELKEKIKIPNTLKNKSAIIIVIGLISSLIVLIYESNKKNI